MAQTQRQLDDLIANAQYHLEVVLGALPTLPQRSGICEFAAVVTSCYRSPSPLVKGTAIRLILPVIVEGDPMAPGIRHVQWSALKKGRSIEIVANGNGAELRVVDGGLSVLPDAVGMPSLGNMVPHNAPPPQSWWRSWLS